MLKKEEKVSKMAKRKKVDFNLASEVFEDASLADMSNKEEVKKTFINLSDLKSNPYQPRLQMDKDHIEELAESIDKNGLLQAITVLNNKDGSYTVVFGHRRVAAYSYLDKESIEATVIDSLDKKHLVITPIVENLQRKDMEPIETALALDKVLKMKVVMTQEELSKSIGLSQGRISKLLSILKLSNEVLDEVKLLKFKDATILAALNKVEKEKQLEIFNNIKNMKREDALLLIKKVSQNIKVPTKRVVHSNSSIKINTKGISVETKEKLLEYLHQIEKLLS